jgi:hypothetical protein
MPQEPQNNKYWDLCDNLNQKRLGELTEAEKETMEKCRGIKEDKPCLQPLFRCVKCGYYGCVQSEKDVCTEQGFVGDICVNCGSAGTQIPILENELAGCRLDWNVELEAENMLEEE